MHGLYVSHVRFFTALEDEYVEMTVLYISFSGGLRQRHFRDLFLLIFGCTEIGLHWLCFSWFYYLDLVLFSPCCQSEQTLVVTHRQLRTTVLQILYRHSQTYMQREKRIKVSALQEPPVGWSVVICSQSLKNTRETNINKPTSLIISICFMKWPYSRWYDME